MKREDWDRIGSLFDEALKRSGAERHEFLASLGDENLEQELRSLLGAHEGRRVFDELADYVSGPGTQRLLRLGPGDEIGPYRIVCELGSGGMATVYEAEDLKHERQVAIKVLRPELAALLGADRFLQEITTTAKLQHPHILPLLDSGQAEGLLYYVMPCIEGETLRGKLDREKQLGIEEAVRIATEVADALDYAHRHDVIHRDMKPENILLHEGRPLVADFGIALAVSAAAGGRITETGLSLGTPQYMSPEQATADKDVTHRSDIYSLGCVLYEMLTGVVTEDVQPVTDLRKSVPPNVAAAAAKSLEKLPADRFESARTFAEALGDPTFTTPTARVVSGIAQPPGHWKRLALGLFAVAVVATVAAVWGWLRDVALDGDRRVTEFTLAPPDPTMSFGGGLALSPDGRRLVAQVETDAGPVLYQRMLDSRDWQIIPGTQGAYGPFFSPDGKWLGFLSNREGAVMKIPVEGGSAQAITRVSMFHRGAGASWGPDNTVVFSTADNAGLFRVAVDGGDWWERLTTLDIELGEVVHSQPHHLGSGEVVLFSATRTDLGPFVAALSLESGEVSRLTPGLTPLSNGADRVVYVTLDGTAVAQRFNPRTLALEGPPRPIAEGVKIAPGNSASYTVSSSGSLAYLSRPAGGDQLLLVNREGRTRPLFSSRAGSRLAGPRFSPSGNRIAFVRGEAGEFNGDVWVYSFAEGTARRLSFEGPSADPAWTSDGRSIGYSALGEGGGSYGLYLRAADGTGPAVQVLVCDDDLWQLDFASGDSEIVFFRTNTVFGASLGSHSGPVLLIEAGPYVTDPILSPDGRFLAYSSFESGILEVYVRSYPDMGPPTLVSIGGGYHPAWSGDGSEIFYWSHGRMMAASVRYEGSRVRVDRRAELFRLAPFRESDARNYALHPNGQQFVMVGDPATRVVWRVNALAGER
jgi:Tol biopolymer transport system component